MKFMVLCSCCCCCSLPLIQLIDLSFHFVSSASRAWGSTSPWTFLRLESRLPRARATRGCASPVSTGSLPTHRPCSAAPATAPHCRRHTSRRTRHASRTSRRTSRTKRARPSLSCCGRATAMRSARPPAPSTQSDPPFFPLPFFYFLNGFLEILEFSFSLSLSL